MSQEAKQSSETSSSENGPISPFELSKRRRWLWTVLLSFTTLTVTFSSSVFSSTVEVTSKEFGVSEIVMMLGVSLFVLGFSIGPIVWGPLSELKGRRLPLFTGYLVFALMQIPIALSHNVAGILICRFLAGAFGASPVVLVSTVYADIWPPAERGIATAFYAAAVYAGPTLGPIIGSLFTESRLGWRWTAWFTLIVSVIVGTAALLVVPETYMPVLRARAAEKRGGIHGSTQTAGQSTPPDWKTFFQKYILRPALMLIYEPMLVVLTLYISIVYGILYLTFFAFPYSFSSQRGWDPRVGTLPFLSILIGVLASSLFLAIYSWKYYQTRLVRRGSILPEDRLPPMMAGSFMLPAGLFVFAWTSSPDITPVPQILSGVLIGGGIMLVFSSGVAFIVDIYLASSASAIAANTCVRSLVAAGFPLAAPQMYRVLDTAWATSVLGFLCVIVIPAPILFYIYGARLRQMSRYAQTRSE